MNETGYIIEIPHSSWNNKSQYINDAGDDDFTGGGIFLVDEKKHAGLFETKKEARTCIKEELLRKSYRKLKITRYQPNQDTPNE